MKTEDDWSEFNKKLVEQERHADDAVSEITEAESEFHFDVTDTPPFYREDLMRKRPRDDNVITHRVKSTVWYVVVYL